ncbi:MAG: hypothetical protein KJ065_05805 [Anaerolineae bacterium]|nr:hypothetical protein [Anaerolineae bacterium]
MSSPRKYALDFRSEETRYVMERWLATQSCALVGIGSVGKSNMLRHLSNPEVQAHYLGKQNADALKTILIDPNMLGTLPAHAQADEPLRAWAGYELLMHRLYLAFYPLSDVLGPEDARRFYETYQALQDGNNPLYAYMSVRYFELGLQFFMRRGYKIIFMFDEFEALMRQMPVPWFHNLRGLRDANKSQIAYLTFTRAPLKVLAAQFGIPALEFEPFEELFSDNTYFVGPYDDTDALRMLNELSSRSGKYLPESTAQMLVRLTGGYAGLLRSAFSIIDPGSQVPLNDDSMTAVAQFLAAKSPIRAECKVIWASLTQAEHYLLKAVARLGNYEINPETEQALNQLIQKRILRLDKITQQLEIHPPLFRLYVLANRDEA